MKIIKSVINKYILLKMNFQIIKLMKIYKIFIKLKDI